MGKLKLELTSFPSFFLSPLSLKKKYHLRIIVHVSTLPPTHDVETERKNEATKMSSSYVTFAHSLLFFVRNELNRTTLAAGNPDQNERED